MKRNNHEDEYKKKAVFLFFCFLPRVVREEGVWLHRRHLAVVVIAQHSSQTAPLADLIELACVWVRVMCTQA